MTKVITPEILKEWNPCKAGFKCFKTLIPKGETLEKCCEILTKNDHEDYSLWLFNRAKENRFDIIFTDKGYRNTGYRNTGDRNTGSCNTGNCNTGYRNTGNCNTGNWNTGNWNTGNRNTGNCNTGNCNTGNWNTGNWNTGYRNTGNWNTGYRNTGFFNIDEPRTIRIFGKDISIDEWIKYKIPSFLYFELTEWIAEENMTEEERTIHPEHHYLGGYLKEYEYKDAFKKSWNNADKKDRAKIKDCPNFDAKMFFEISGINVDE